MITAMFEIDKTTLENLGTDDAKDFRGYLADLGIFPPDDAKHFDVLHDQRGDTFSFVFETNEPIEDDDKIRVLREGEVLVSN